MWTESDWAASMTCDASGSMMWMDPLHVRVIYDLCMACRWEDVLEIGSWDGFSASAVVQAAIDSGLTRLWCCDLQLRPELQKVCAKHPFSATLVQGCSVDLLSFLGPMGAVILDGDHSWENVHRELVLLLREGWQTIIAHDVGRIGGVTGPQRLRQELEHTEDWVVLVDEIQREGQRTDRGLMLATRSPSVARAARKIFDALPRVP